MGRLIVEYRHGGNVTRLERDVHGRSSWDEADRAALERQMTLARQELADAVFPEAAVNA